MTPESAPERRFLTLERRLDGMENAVRRLESRSYAANKRLDRIEQERQCNQPNESPSGDGARTVTSDSESATKDGGAKTADSGSTAAPPPPILEAARKAEAFVKEVLDAHNRDVCGKRMPCQDHTTSHVSADTVGSTTPEASPNNPASSCSSGGARQRTSTTDPSSADATNTARPPIHEQVRKAWEELRDATKIVARQKKGTDTGGAMFCTVEWVCICVVCFTAGIAVAAKYLGPKP